MIFNKADPISFYMNQCMVYIRGVKARSRINLQEEGGRGEGMYAFTFVVVIVPTSGVKGFALV